MTRRIPIVATLVVAAAVATMIALGVWQLQRREEKRDLLQTFAARAADERVIEWPAQARDGRAALYRKAKLTCVETRNPRAVAGRSAAGQAGWAHLVTCRTGDGRPAEVALGWSATPAVPRWTGGPLTGTIASAGRGIRLVAAPPVGGLQQLAAPDPADIPNNHLSYAVQWFAFAATALVIYALALRRRAPGVNSGDVAA